MCMHTIKSNHDNRDKEEVVEIVMKGNQTIVRLESAFKQKYSDNVYFEEGFSRQRILAFCIQMAMDYSASDWDKAYQRLNEERKQDTSQQSDIAIPGTIRISISEGLEGTFLLCRESWKSNRGLKRIVNEKFYEILIAAALLDKQEKSNNAVKDGKDRFETDMKKISLEDFKILSIDEKLNIIFELLSNE